MRSFLALILVAACSNSEPTPKMNATILTIANHRPVSTTVHVSFGADSKITADDWSFCSGSKLVCTFTLRGVTSQSMPNPRGKYTNATFAFDQAVGCGSTKAEVNINNPAWYDILDVSLVDGFSNKIKINAVPIGVVARSARDVQLGPVKRKNGNENLLGVFPYGCDTCVERQNPSCGISKGKNGCKTGTQYDPKPPCQWQGSTKGGGNLSVTVTLVP